ncbi:MAG: alpha/beta hydrolase, partial [Myxococcota bacterium]
MKERERFITVGDGQRLFSTEVGAGPPVLLCDGLGCDGYIWQHLRPALAREHRVIHWHYRGHGKSDSPRVWSELAVPTLIRDMIAVLDAYEVERCTLIGHSMGVQVILQAAVDHPQRFDAVIPMCGSYGRPLDTFYGTDTMLHVLPVVLEASERFTGLGQRLWSAVNEWPVAREFARTREMGAVAFEQVRPYFEHMAGMDMRVFFRTLAHLRDHSVEGALDQIRMPTLIIAGEHDSFTPVWLSRKMARLIPNAELVVVSGGSHVTPLEEPGLVEEHVLEFLDNRV